MRWRRFFKQLEFTFLPKTVVAPFAVVGRPLRLPSSKSASDALALQFVRRRDHALERQARELLRSFSAEKLAREIRVKWNPRMRTCAGRADYRQKLISLNPLLLELDHSFGTHQTASKLECKMHSSSGRAWTILNLNDDTTGTDSGRGKLDWLNQSSSTNGQRKIVCDEVDRTLRHELAHLLAQWRVGRRRIAPHGKQWRQACVDLGIGDEARCHNLPFATKSFPPRYVYRCPNCNEEFPRVRRIRRAIACLACCRKHNGGDFDPQFRLKLIR